MSEVAHARHVFHQYTIRVHEGKRGQAVEALTQAGIQTMIYYPVPVHRLPVYNAPLGILPKTGLAAEEVLSLPIWPELEAKTQLRILEVLECAIRSAGKG